MSAATFRSRPRNWSGIACRWPTTRALLASHRPKFTDSDLSRIDGRRHILARVQQERYGLDDHEAEATGCVFEKDVRRPGAVK
jgi:hypothetical protein